MPSIQPLTVVVSADTRPLERALTRVRRQLWRQIFWMRAKFFIGALLGLLAGYLLGVAR